MLLEMHGLGCELSLNICQCHIKLLQHILISECYLLVTACKCSLHNDVTACCLITHKFMLQESISLHAQQLLLNLNTMDIVIQNLILISESIDIHGPFHSHKRLWPKIIASIMNQLPDYVYM